MASPPTKSGTRKLSEVARKVVIPSGVVSTGWPAVRDLCNRKLGVQFDPWQDGAGRIILAKRADGKLAVMIGGVGMSLPRQVGKTYLIGAIVFALCILNPGMLVIWSAHHARTHGETFLAVQAFADRAKVKPYIRQIFTGSGDEEIRFLNGSRILFGARERGFGRGIPGVSMIVSDEAQIMSDKAMDAQLATMNTSQFGLAIYVGTPPRPDDPSEAFTRMRKEAWSGVMQDSAWIEFGADPDSDPDDRKQWARANPSFPSRTPVESMLRLRRKLQPDSFLREGLGVWVDDGATGAGFDYPAWLALADPDAERGMPTFGVATAPDRSWSAVGVSWVRPDGNVQVMLARYDRDATWVREYVTGLREKWGGQVFADAASRDLVDGAENLSGPEMARAHNQLADAVIGGWMRHGNEPALNNAVRAARWRLMGETRVLDRKGPVDISPLAPVALAASRDARSRYESKDLVVL